MFRSPLAYNCRESDKKMKGNGSNCWTISAFLIFLNCHPAISYRHFIRQTRQLETLPIASWDHCSNLSGMLFGLMLLVFSKGTFKSFLKHLKHCVIIPRYCHILLTLISFNFIFRTIPSSYEYS